MAARPGWQLWMRHCSLSKVSHKFVAGQTKKTAKVLPNLQLLLFHEPFFTIEDVSFILSFTLTLVKPVN